MKNKLRKFETENKKTTCAIICELNPMHSGHVHLLNQAKKITNCDYIIGLMSGNFSERSEACLLDKYSRAKIGTKNGFDLIIGLPTAFCTNNAEVFALSSIKILNNLGIDYLAFGVETKNEKAFYSLANFMLHEPKSFKIILKQNLKKGLAYFNAYTLSIETYFNDKSEISKDFIRILTKPNNILALEYIKSIIKTKSKIKPIFVERIDNYNNNEIKQNFASASFLRKKIIENSFDEIKQFLPEFSHSYFIKNLSFFNAIFDEKSQQKTLKFNLETQNQNSIIFEKNNSISHSNSNENNNPNFQKNFIIPEKLKTLILYKIKATKIKNLKQIYAINEGFENKLKNESFSTTDFDNFYNSIQSKRIKQNKINSILLNTLLEIDKKTIKKLYTTKTNIFAKILAINPQKREILGKINTKFLISRKKDVNMLKLNFFNKKLFEIENNANIVYNLCFQTSLFENDLLNKMQ